MNANRVTYTAFVAFLSAILTLVVVSLVAPGDEARALAGEKEWPEFSLEAVSRHDDADSCWKVIEGKVYDLTDYIPMHPSAEDDFLPWCGRDATQAWYDKGKGGSPHSQRARKMLERFQIGVLAGQ